MAAPNRAKPQGRRQHDSLRPTPTDPGRQSRGPSTPTGKRPGPGGAKGGDGRSSNWGQHLQSNADKGGPSSYRKPSGGTRQTGY